MQCKHRKSNLCLVFKHSVLCPDSSQGGRDTGEDETGLTVYRGVVWVFANISGLITFLPDGTLHSINENFALVLFGYSQEELVGKVRDYGHLLVDQLVHLMLVFMLVFMFSCSG